MTEWKKVKLGNVCISIQPGPFGTQLHNSDYTANGIPVIMPRDMIDGRISNDKLEFVSEETANKLNRHQVHESDIIVARKGDVRKCIHITPKEEGWLTGSDCLKVSVDSTLVYPLFIYYQLKSEHLGKWMQTIAKGATMPSLNTSLLSSIDISLPDLPTQQRIAETLARYDALIENYQKQIKLLEEAAQRLYKEWFVDFRFPGYENTRIVDGVPEGWEKKKVGDMLTRTTRTKLIPTNEYLPSGIIPIIDQSRSYIAGYTNDLDSKVVISVPMILFGDHTRVLKYLPFSFARGADGTQLIMSNDIKHLPQSLFFNALIAADLSNYSYARHFKYLKAEQILIPTENIAVKFDECVSIIYDQVQNCREQQRLLTEARDRLLPKLMNGGIAI